MSLRWRKRGVFFNPSNHALDFEVRSFAQAPQALVCHDFVRIYFSTRQNDSAGRPISRVEFIDADMQLRSVVGHSRRPVLAPGALGAFDEHGVFPFSPLRSAGCVWAYTCGWSRRISVPLETATGLAISRDDGLTFQRFNSGPVFAASLYEPFLVGDSFVRIYDGVFHMWYIYGVRWNPRHAGEPPARIYKIAHATSPDGLNWTRDGVQLLPDVLGHDECQALPTVLKLGGHYHMYFCFRHATDFRNNPDRGYRLGYAWSVDLRHWTRADDLAGIQRSDSGWDSEMMCYPHLFACRDHVFLLYNGNQFGRYGFGVAELEAA